MHDTGSPTSSPSRLFPPWLAGRWGAVAIVAILYTLLDVAWTIFKWGGPGRASLINDLVSLPPSVAVTATAWVLAWRAPRGARQRRAWFLLGLAFLSYFVANTIWAYLVQVAHTRPFPSVADVFYLAFYPFMLVSVQFFAEREPDRRQRLLLWLDLLSIFTAAAMLVGYFIVGPTAAANNSDLLTEAVAIAYPLGSLVLIGAIGAILYRRPLADFGYAHAYFLIGTAIYLAADLAWGYAGLAGTYVEGGWIDAGWNVSQLFFVLAAVRQLHRGGAPWPEPQWPSRHSHWLRRLPLAGLLLSYGLVLYVLIWHFDPSAEWLLAGALLLTGLMLARAMLTSGFGNLGIRTKVLLLLLVAVAFSVGLVTLTSYLTLRSRLESAVGATLKIEAGAEAEAIANLLTKQHDILEGFTFSYILQDRAIAANESYPADQAVVQGILQRRDAGWQTAGSNDPLVSSTLSGELVGQLRSLLAYFPGQTEALVTDRYGATLAATTRPAHYYHGNEEWWQAAYNNGQGANYIARPTADQTDGGLRLVFAQPVLTGIHGQVVGVIWMTYSIQDVVALLASDSGQSVEYDVLLPGGQLLTPGGALLKLEPAALARLDSTNRADDSQFSLNGPVQLISQAPVPGDDPDTAAAIKNLNWAVVSRQTPAAAFAPVMAAGQTALLSVLVVLLLTTGLATAVSSLLVAPLARLTRVAEQIAVGDLSTRAQVESRDEIGTLGSAFNGMLDRLHANINQLNTAQESLQDSERRYRRLVDFFPDLVAVFGQATTLFINPAGEKLLGVKSSADLANYSLLDLVPPGGQAAAQRGLRHAEPGGEPSPWIEGQMQRLDGTIFDAEFRVIPITYARQPAIQVVMRDVTERKRAEEELRKFKLGIERSTEAVFMTDTDGTIRYINPGFTRVYGFAWGESVGQTPRILKSGMLSPADYQRFWATLLAKGTVASEIVNRAKDGRLINIEGSNNPILDEAGHLLGFLAVHRDVTARKQTEVQVRQNAARAEALANVASIVNARLDLGAVSQAICVEAARALHVPVVTVWFMSEHQDQLELARQVGLPTESLPAFQNIAHTYMGALINHSGPVLVVPDLQASADVAPGALFGALNLRTILAANMIQNEQMVGVLAVMTRDEPRAFTADELALLKGLADQAALALSNARLFAEVERQRGDLELRVSQRTEQLNGLNQQLQAELAQRQDLLQSLGESEQRFRKLFDASPEAIFLIDPHGATALWPIVDCNEAACQMNGYTRGELIGQSMDLLNAKHGTSAEFALVLEDLRRAAMPRSAESAHIHKDGHIFPIEYATVLINVGERELVLGIDRDITRRRQTEAALQDAKELAEAASRAKSEFLSRMSHELRTPMNAILGFAQLLALSRKDPLTPGQAERVHQIVKGGQHLLDLINEILDLSRIEAGRLQVSREPVRVMDALREVLELTAPLAAKGEIEIHANLVSAANPYVMADRQRLKQVLLNLLSNAIKYNHPGGQVTVTCLQAQAGCWRLSVLDTGPGIAADGIVRLFVPFERLTADQSAVEGTGLGLAIAKRLTELMGGRIGVDSIVGQGSTFWVELSTAEAQLERLQRTMGTGPLPILSPGARRILYIEDNAANFELVRQVLADFGQIELLWASEGQVGLELARRHRPDLVLLDLHLGATDGAAILKQLKQDTLTSAIPVIVVSADATSGQAERLRMLGAVAYLTKPLNVKQFMALLEENLGQSGG